MIKVWELDQSYLKIFSTELTRLSYHNFLLMAEEVAVIAHTKTNLLDSVLKSSVSSGIAKAIIMNI